MSARGPPAMTVERAFFSNAGSLRLVASYGSTRSWSLAHGEPGQHHRVQVEPAEQDVKIAGQRVEVVSDAGPAGRAEAAPVVGDDPVTGGQQRCLCFSHECPFSP